MNLINKARAVTPEVLAELDELFTYLPWDDEQIGHGKAVRESLQSSAIIIINNVPPCPTRTVALRKLTEARMDCNSAITHRGKY